MKTIFHKLAFVYVAVFLVSFLIIMIGVRTALEYYFINHETDMIINKMAGVEQALNYTNSEEINYEVLSIQLKLVEEYSGADIIIVKDDNSVYVPYGTDVSQVDTSYITQDSLDRVMGGEIISDSVSGTAGIQNEVILVGYPLNFGSDTLAMFFIIPLPTINALINDVTMIIFVSMSLSAIVVIIIIFLMTRRMRMEIKTIGDAARYISEGNFDKKIKINRNDELGELAESFNNMATELEKTENIRRRFISSLSHDMRTPLTTISGYTRGMLDGTIEEKKFNRYLGIVLSESERLVKLSNDLLDLSKMETGEVALNQTDFDINEVIINVLDSFEQKIINKNIKLNIDFSSEKILAHGDRDSIQRVVYNLLDNATKFVEQEGSISIRTELKLDKYYVGISNSGKILSAKELDIIWDRFTKLDKSRSLDKTSSGLGLSIVKEIIRAHGEKIEVYSNEDIGVAFIFTISTQIFK